MFCLSSQNQCVNLPVRLPLAPAVERERSVITPNCSQLDLTCRNLHLANIIVFLNNLGVITCSNLIYCLIPLDLNLIKFNDIHLMCVRKCCRDTLYNISSCQLCAPPATTGERTCEEVDTLCCQVSLWEDEGELAESAPLISLYTTSARDLQTCLSGGLSGSWWLHSLTTAYFSWVKEKICVCVH